MRAAIILFLFCYYSLIRPFAHSPIRHDTQHHHHQHLAKKPDKYKTKSRVRVKSHVTGVKREERREKKEHSLYLPWLQKHPRSYRRQPPRAPIPPNHRERSHSAHILPLTIRIVLQILLHRYDQLLNLPQVSLPQAIRLLARQSSQR